MRAAEDLVMNKMDTVYSYPHGVCDPRGCLMTRHGRWFFTFFVGYRSSSPNHFLIKSTPLMKPAGLGTWVERTLFVQMRKLILSFLFSSCKGNTSRFTGSNLMAGFMCNGAIPSIRGRRSLVRSYCHIFQSHKLSAHLIQISVILTLEQRGSISAYKHWEACSLASNISIARVSIQSIPPVNMNAVPLLCQTLAGFWKH